MFKDRGLYLLFFVCIVALSTCKKNSSPPAPVYSISLKLDGTAYTFANPVVQSNQSTMIITGKNGNASLTLQIINYHVGTVAIVAPSVILYILTGTAEADAYQCTTGSLTISTLNSSVITGTFAATAIDFPDINTDPTNTSAVTAGAFNVNLAQ